MEDVGDGCAIDPTGGGELGPAAEGVTEGEEKGGDGDDEAGHFPVGIFLAEGEFFARRNEGAKKEDESKVGQGGVRGEVVAMEEGGDDEPEDEGGGASEDAEGVGEGGGDGEDEKGEDVGGLIPEVEGIGEDAEGGIEGGIGDEALIGEELGAVGDEGEEVPGEEGAEEDAEESELRVHGLAELKLISGSGFAISGGDGDLRIC